MHAGDLDATEHDRFMEAPETNVERKLFNKLLIQMSRELETCEPPTNRFQKPIDVLEVFCGPHSQLTHQCQQLGHRAMRFGLAEGDLQTVEGRARLFTVLNTHRPRHVWFSPKCGPWSSWSNLNGSRSIESWDNLQQCRLQHRPSCFRNCFDEVSEKPTEAFSLGTTKEFSHVQTSLHARNSTEVTCVGCRPLHGRGSQRS